MESLDTLLAVAIEAMDIARELVRTRLPGSVTAKGDRDPASEVDFAVERAVRDYLKKLTPEIGFLGEEEGPRGDISGNLFWALDPVDGTVNFIREIGRAHV